jgi:hypothetical protein
MDILQEMQQENQRLKNELDAAERVLEAHKEWAKKVHSKLQMIYACDPNYELANRNAFLER